ncbi:MAG: glycosyltransferase [Ignavibacteria bacterium]|nr:glycosyltransferase [Ignavibacteria bacterium]
MKKYNIESLIILPKKGPVEDVLKSLNFNYRIIPFKLWLNNNSGLVSKFKRILWNIIIMIPYAFILKKYKFDLIYTNTSTVSFGAFIAKLLKLPHLWHFREFGFEDHGYIYDLGNVISKKLTNYLSTLCLVNSNAVLNKYKNFINTDKLFLLYEAYYDNNIYNITADFKPSFSSKLNCIIIGTIHRGKQQLDAIKAVDVCRKHGIDVSLTILGSGDPIYKNEIIDYINQNKLNSYITFIDNIENPKKILPFYDILLMCSKNEAFGLVTLEALECGVPVIGTKSGGTVELINDNINGLLYNPGDFVDLAGKISYLYHNPEKRIEMGKNGKDNINIKFSPARYIDQCNKYILMAIDKFNST